MPKYYKLPLVLTPQPEGGYTVTSPALPELITEGDTVEDALTNVRDALEAVLDAYDQLGRALPPGLERPSAGQPIQLETVVATA